MARNSEQDLFEGTTMTFGEHLDELRVVLFRSLIGLLVCCVIGLVLAKQVVKKVQGPLKTALETYYLDKAKKELMADHDDVAPPEMLALIDSYELIPESIQMDVGGFIKNLQAAYPKQFGGIPFKQHQFALADLRPDALTAFSKSLSTKSQKTTADGGPTAEGVFWGLLTAEEKDRVKDWAGADDSSAEDQASAIAMLNRVAELPAVYQSKPFKDQITSNSAEAALAEAALSDDDSRRRLHRLVIAKVFDKFLYPPQLHLIDVPVWKPISVRVQTLNAHEAFMIWLKAAFLTGLVLASPWIFYQVWTFVGAGLYRHERRYVYIYLPFSTLLFLCGAGMAFFFVFEHVLNFLFSFNYAMEIDPDPRISEWLSFVLFLPIGFGIAFQLPLVMLFLHRLGIFSIQAYLSKWRIAVLIIFVLSMLLTPADPVSMMLMAVPMTVLYFLGIALCRWMPRGRNPYKEGYEPGEG